MESTFRANERKIRESKARCSGKGTEEIYKPKWEYYDMLLFLKKTCAQSDAIDNISQNYSSSSQVNCSSASHLSNVQNTITNIYYDENTEVSVKFLSLCFLFVFHYFNIIYILINIYVQYH